MSFLRTLPFTGRTFARKFTQLPSARTFSLSAANMKPVILYTAATPNGQKASIMLEEIKAINPSFEYEVKAIDMSKNQQKEPAFLALNPNGRIPALLDPNNTATHPDGFPVFESMSIMLYLEKMYDSDHAFSWPSTDPKGDNFRSQVLQYMSFQMGGQGPMQGQANHFRMQAVGDSKNVVPYGIKRYHDESVRLYQVLESVLKDRDYLVGDGKGKYSLADMILFPWALWTRFAGLKNDEVGPNVHAWVKRIKERPAVKKGLEVPSRSELLDKLDDPNWMPEMPDL